MTPQMILAAVVIAFIVLAAILEIVLSKPGPLSR